MLRDIFAVFHKRFIVEPYTAAQAAQSEIALRGALSSEHHIVVAADLHLCLAIKSLGISPAAPL